MTFPCDHSQSAARVDVIRLEDVGRWCAQVQIQCALCGVRFRFLGGLPVGTHLEQITTDPEGAEMRVPIHPEGEDLPTIPAGTALGALLTRPDAMGPNG